MSIYRKLDPYRRAQSDGRGNEPAEKRSVPPHTTSQESAGFEEYDHLRTAAPANAPLPATLEWAASLPPNVQPTALLRHYARIANLIVATWKNPKFFDSYMESLLTTNRKNRRGFPPEILSELVALQRWHNTLRHGTSGSKAAGKFD